ncbi:FTR1 family protein [Celerinatantimonas sp. MCCC 1A17872]|uniref:FTR1 family iron permease n=1 Tax=Celerinatantimonas sp. MCCC 1A17872 TaxID=3177514 RepID=UPI0038CA64CC
MNCIVGALVLAFLLISTEVLAATVDYQAAADDINSRLDKALVAYNQSDAAKAKSIVQMAYFEVFEGIEGPIRINYSQKYSYKLEAKFTEIRKLIAQNAPKEKVAAQIAWLKGQIETVPGILKSGHQLVAETQNMNQKDILPYYREQVLTLESLMNQALASYRLAPQVGDDAAQAKNRQHAYDLLRQAQFDNYKNSDLETAIRRNDSQEKAAQYNDRFQALEDLSLKPFTSQNLVKFGYQLSTLVSDLKDDLPGLPAIRDSQKEQDSTTADVSQKDWSAVVIKIDQAVKQAIYQYSQGHHKQAMMAVQDSYFDLFEASGMENAVGARDVTFKSELEGYFTRLVSLMKADASLDELANHQSAMSQALQKGADMLGSGSQGFWAIFLASLTIILREGLEALLIVAAIVAYLVKNNHQDKLKVIKNSVVVGLVASVITAALFQWLFTNAGASREMLEGITMLIAVVVLFSMSYWLLSKVEAHKWQNYLQSKLSRSLTSGSIAGLWFASFLAVYREGAETVLFYYALGSGTSSSSIAALFSGLGVGIVLLVAIFFLMRYSVVKLPLKPFFIFTGCFMYLMAFVFAGNGVLELIEAKLFNPTLFKGGFEISLLGIYPYIETVTPQLVLVFAAIVALVVIRQQGRKQAIHN